MNCKVIDFYLIGYSFYFLNKKITDTMDDEARIQNMTISKTSI